MVDADINIVTTLLFLSDEAGGQAATSCVYDSTALLSLDRWVETEILATCEAQSTELFFVSKFLCPVFHQRLQLCECFLDLRHGTWGGALVKMDMAGVVYFLSGM